MTIGIAAAGTGAGWAILDTLARIECLAEGAIGGFLSVAAMDERGRILRAEVQDGGARALLEQGVDACITAANRAVLMSSGPNRPEPLSQFTPGRDGVGIVTGHRFPNTLDVNGRPLGESALDLVAEGAKPAIACTQVMKCNPRADAGLIIVDANGCIGAANSALVASYPDSGFAEIKQASHAVAVLHNAIKPSGSLAELVAEMVSYRLTPQAGETASIELHSGVPVVPSDTSSVVLAEADGIITLRLATAYNGDDLWSAGLGPGAPVIKGDRLVGRMIADPYLTIKNGKLLSANGMASTTVPIRLE